MTTYPEMNAQIVGLLRQSDDPSKLYAADRIEELEAKVALADELATSVGEVMIFPFHSMCGDSAVGSWEMFRKVLLRLKAILARYQSGGPSFASLALAWAEAQSAVDAALFDDSVQEADFVDAVTKRNDARAAYEQARKGEA